MRFIERAAVLLASCVLIAVLVDSRQDVPPAAAEVTGTPSACTARDQQAVLAQHQRSLATRVPQPPLLSHAQLVTLPRHIQDQAADAMLMTIEPTAEAMPAGSDFEQFVLALPRQIQDQVRVQRVETTTTC